LIIFFYFFKAESSTEVFGEGGSGVTFTTILPVQDALKCACQNCPLGAAFTIDVD